MQARGGSYVQKCECMKAVKSKTPAPHRKTDRRVLRTRDTLGVWQSDPWPAVGRWFAGSLAAAMTLLADAVLRHEGVDAVLIRQSDDEGL